MMKLRSYTCEKCGGVLSVEKTQRVLDCPFCGNTFRAVSFHRNEVVRQAVENLKRKEFSAADEKYREILEDDPENFDALLGMIFSAGKIPSSNMIANIKSASAYNMTKALKRIRTEAGYSSGSGPYFSKLSELLEMAMNYRELDAQVAQIRKENKKEYGKISEVQESEATIRRAVPAIAKLIGSIFFLIFAHERDSSGGVIGLVTIFLLLLIFLIYNLGAPTGFLVFLIILGVIITIGVISSKLVAKKHQERVDAFRKETTANHTEFLQIDNEMRSLEKAYTEGYAELKKLRPSEAAIAALSQERAKKEKPEVFSEEKKQVFCTKCGGELSLDRDRSLYTCKFCGVACGASLFIGDLPGKAKKALSIKEFEEAEICFAHNLMMHPDDFDSLLGRILAEGMWRSIDDFELKEETHIPPFRIKNLLARIGEAKAHASEEDQVVFTDLEQLVNIVPQAETLAKELKLTGKQSQWYAQRNKFYTIRHEIQYRLSARA